MPWAGEGAGRACGRSRRRRRSGGCRERAAPGGADRSPDRRRGGRAGRVPSRRRRRRDGRRVARTRAARAPGTRRLDSRRSAARRRRRAACVRARAAAPAQPPAAVGAGPRSSGSAPASSRSSCPPATIAICSALSPAASAARSTTDAAAIGAPVGRVGGEQDLAGRDQREQRELIGGVPPGGVEEQVALPGGLAPDPGQVGDRGVREDQRDPRVGARELERVPSERGDAPAGVHDDRQPALVGHGEDPADRRVAQPEPLGARMQLDARRAATDGALDLARPRRRRADRRGRTRPAGPRRPAPRRASGRWRRDSHRVRPAGTRPRDRRRPRALPAAHRPRSRTRPDRHSQGACGSRTCVSSRAGPAGRRTTARAARRQPSQPRAAARLAAETGRCSALGWRGRLGSDRGCWRRAGSRTSVITPRAAKGKARSRRGGRGRARRARRVPPRACGPVA